MAQRQFKEGDKVRHTGKEGTAMVVDEVKSSFAVCLVVSEDGLEKKLFPLSSLALVEDPPSAVDKPS